MKPILQYQEGGDIKSLFVDYQPFQGLNRTAKNTPQRATSSSEGGEKSSSKVGLKDLLGLVKELKGLPVDNNIVVQQIQSMYEDAALFNNGEMSTNELVSTYLSALRSIRMAEFNQQEFNDARKQVVANGGLNEFAIDLHGNIYIQDQETGEIKNVTPEQYNKIKDNDNYQALTNSNLLYYRANDPNFAFKNDILNIVSNGIGMKQITEQLLAVSSKIGTSTLKQQGYSEKNAQGIVQGMASLEKAFQQGMTVEGLYHQGVITKDQSEQAKLALTYLWNTLPENARALLKVKGGSKKGAFELIQSLVFSGLDSEIEYSSDLIKNPNDNDSSSGSGNSSVGGDAKGIEMTPSIGFVLGMGYSREIKMNPGTVYEFKLHGINGIITDHSGKPLGEYSTLNDASNGAFAGILDWNNATYGGVKIETLNKVFLKNADIVSVDLPIDVQYFSETGIIRPDIELTAKMQKLDQAIQQKKVDKNNAEQVNAFCKSINLPSMYIGYDENGHPKLDTAYYARFARVGALVDENSLQEDVDVGVYASHEASDKVRENFKQYMKTVDKNYSLDDGGLFSTHDKLYEGAVFIPIREDIIASTYGGNKYYKLPQENAISAAQRWADDQKVQTYNPGKKLGELK